MAGFLRKKATLKVSKQDSSFISPAQRPSDDAPPSLPPLILSLSLVDPDPDIRAPLPPAASPPVLPLPAPAPEYLLLDDAWDPWKAFSDSPSAPRLDSQSRPHVTGPSSQKHDPPPQPNRDTAPIVQNSPRSVPQRPPASNASVEAPNVSNKTLSRLSTVATAPAPRKISTRQPPHDAQPKSDAPGNQSLTQIQSPPSLIRPSKPPAVVRGQVPPPTNFDFEDSLSAANVTSVVNQFRSHPPIRHHTSPAPPSQTSQMDTQHPPSSMAHRHYTAPQKPGSSSSLSSGSHHTDATRRTNGSYGTSSSASSVSPAGEVIDLDKPVGSLLHHSYLPFTANGPSTSVVRSSRGPIDHNLSALASPTSRPSTSPNVTARVYRSPTAPSVPPTSYPDRVRTVARQTSHSNLSSGFTEPHARPMLYDMLRSGNPQLTTPLRKGPLIFSAAAATPQPNGPAVTNGYNPYPSPPAEHASYEGSHSRRKSSVSSGSHGQRVSSAFDATDFTHLTRKSSKGNLTLSAGSRADAGAEHVRPRVLTKARPTTPQKSTPPPTHKVLPQPGDPLLLDDDPFARVEGVKMLKPRSGTPSSCCTSLRDGFSSEDGHVPPLPNDLPTMPPSIPAGSPLTPPDDYKAARQQRRGQWLEKTPPAAVTEVVAKRLTEEGERVEREPTPPPTYFPILAFMSDANLLPVLLSYLSYSEWLALYSANKQIRQLFRSRILREFVLERFLSTVGYIKWDYEWAEPLELSLKDLHNYLRGVALPTHQYARFAAAYLQPKSVSREALTTSDTPDILALALTTRAYTRLVLRLRAQAESEARYLKTLQAAESTQTRHASGPGTRQPSLSSRAPSPTSSYSHSRNHSHGKNERNENSSSSALISKFRSPLYRLGRAPVLRVFVPSPDGDWLSDAGIVECEAELKRSGVLKLLRVGDIVWDVAVGDEGNLGRLMWDGSYLVDLDYRYSRMGELSPYFHSLAFSPSYFHRVIRIGASASHNPHCNPIVYVDVSPWGREIAANLQLLQDRARTETPHGALHDVVRWVHRSTFTIRPPVPPSQGQNARLRQTRIPIPNVEGYCIDPGWYGTVVLESEGTHEGLVDLQARCGPGVFPPRAETLVTKMRNEKEKENKRVWRILREKSRPGEIWLRAVQVKERLM